MECGGLWASCAGMYRGCTGGPRSNNVQPISDSCNMGLTILLQRGLPVFGMRDSFYSLFHIVNVLSYRINEERREWKNKCLHPPLPPLFKLFSCLPRKGATCTSFSCSCSTGLSVPVQVLPQSLIYELPWHLRVCTTWLSQLLPFTAMIFDTGLGTWQVLIKTSWSVDW